MQSNNISMHNKAVTATTDNNTATSHRRITTTNEACAACKYQRRKCAADCILAPNFPHDRQQQFLNAHRLFGVSNIVKMVGCLQPPEKDAAMRTIIFQSEARAADPVGGCYRIIRDLEQQIKLATAELEIVLHHLALCRAGACCQEQAPSPLPHDVVVIDDVNSWSCVDGFDVNNAHAESSSSSSFYHDHHMMEECNHDMKIILDQLSGNYDDDRYNFHSHGNILPSNNAILTEENGTFKEEDGDDSEAVATFSTLTNSCDI